MPSSPRMLDMLQALMATPSISCVNPALDQSNRAVIDLLANWLRDLGFNVQILPLPQQPDKANLIATIGTGHGGLVLSGHTDTVPYDEGRWQHNPFTITEQDGRLYGLGSADMKSFFALAIAAIQAIDINKLRKPITLLATADEETSMTGAQALVDSKACLGEYAIIGEPTGMQPIRMHKGIMMESIHIQGQSGHSSNPALGVSALEGMHKVISALLALREQLQSQYQHPLFEVPVPTMNLGHIHGGDNPNRICAECELHIDLRPLPGMSLTDLREQLRECVNHALRDTALRATLNPLFSGVNAFETPTTSPLVQAAQKFTGAEAGAVAFGTEAPYLQQLGMDVIVLGPGDIAQAHQPDEYLALDRIKPTIALLETMIGHFCL